MDDLLLDEEQYVELATLRKNGGQVDVKARSGQRVLVTGRSLPTRTSLVGLMRTHHYRPPRTYDVLVDGSGPRLVIHAAAASSTTFDFTVETLDGQRIGRVHTSGGLLKGGQAQLVDAGGRDLGRLTGLVTTQLLDPSGAVRAQIGDTGSPEMGRRGVSRAFVVRFDPVVPSPVRLLTILGLFGKNRH